MWNPRKGAVAVRNATDSIIFCGDSTRGIWDSMCAAESHFYNRKVFSLGGY